MELIVQVICFVLMTVSAGILGFALQGIASRFFPKKITAYLALVPATVALILLIAHESTILWGFALGVFTLGWVLGNVWDSQEGEGNGDKDSPNL